VTWAIVVYPAWDNWPETDTLIRAAIEEWLHTWVSDGPPLTAEQIDRHIEAVDRDVRYFRVTHEATRVTVTYVVGRSRDQDYIGLLDLRSPPSPRTTIRP
jgi:hypothetical protein